MLRFRTSQSLAQPVAKVFALLSDPRKRPQWQSSLSSVELLDLGEPRVGMRWREAPHGLVSFSLEISRFERDRVWEERLDCALMQGCVCLHFAPAPADSTALQVEVALELRGPLALAAPLVRRVLEREMRNDLYRAERVLRDAARD